MVSARDASEVMRCEELMREKRQNQNERLREIQKREAVLKGKSCQHSIHLTYSNRHIQFAASRQPHKIRGKGGKNSVHVCIFVYIRLDR